MTTAADLINLALKDSGVLGVGQTASAEDFNDAFTRLNWMLGQWKRKRWMVYQLIEKFVVSTGAGTYSVGPGGDIDTPRPDKLEYAFLRQIQNVGMQVDTPLFILESREDYANITLKGLKSFSQVIWYNSTYPIGNIYPWPIPSADLYEVHIGLKGPLEEFTDPYADINLPPEYAGALYYNLAVRLRPAYQLPPDPMLDGLARDAMNVVRNANAQIPSLTLPRRLVRPGNRFNIFSGFPY